MNSFFIVNRYFKSRFPQMSVISGTRWLSYCKRRVLKLANLPTPLSSSARTPGEMSAKGTNPESFDIEHDGKESEFFIRLGEEKAYLQYSQVKPGLVDLEHTVVPEQHRGHGIGHILAKEVFDHFVEKGTNMKLTCTFLQKFYEENPLPHYKERVV